MIPDYFDEYYPDINDSTYIPVEKGFILPIYELSGAFAVASGEF